MVCVHGVDEPAPLGLGGRPLAAGVRELADDALGNELRHPLQRADVGGHPDVDLGDREERVLGGVAHVGRGDHVDRPADAGALDRAEHRHAGRFEGGERLLELERSRSEAFVAPAAMTRRRGATEPVVARREHRQVHPGAEVPALGGEHHRPHRTRRRPLVDDRRKVPPERRHHRIRLVGADHLEVRHLVGDLDVETLVSHPPSFAQRRHWSMRPASPAHPPHPLPARVRVAFRSANFSRETGAEASGGTVGLPSDHATIDATHRGPAVPAADPIRLVLDRTRTRVADRDGPRSGSGRRGARVPGGRSRAGCVARRRRLSRRRCVLSAPRRASGRRWPCRRRLHRVPVPRMDLRRRRPQRVDSLRRADEREGPPADVSHRRRRRPRPLLVSPGRAGRADVGDPAVGRRVDGPLRQRRVDRGIGVAGDGRELDRHGALRLHPRLARDGRGRRGPRGRTDPQGREHHQVHDGAGCDRRPARRSRCTAPARA